MFQETKAQVNIEHHRIIFMRLYDGTADDFKVGEFVVLTAVVKTIRR